MIYQKHRFLVLVASLGTAHGRECLTTGCSSQAKCPTHPGTRCSEEFHKRSKTGHCENGHPWIPEVGDGVKSSWKNKWGNKTKLPGIEEERWGRLKGTYCQNRHCFDPDAVECSGTPPCDYCATSTQDHCCKCGGPWVLADSTVDILFFAVSYCSNGVDHDEKECQRAKRPCGRDKWVYRDVKVERDIPFEYIVERCDNAQLHLHKTVQGDDNIMNAACWTENEVPRAKDDCVGKCKPGWLSRFSFKPECKSGAKKGLCPLPCKVKEHAKISKLFHCQCGRKLTDPGTHDNQEECEADGCYWDDGDILSDSENTRLSALHDKQRWNSHCNPHTLKDLRDSGSSSSEQKQDSIVDPEGLSGRECLAELQKWGYRQYEVYSHCTKLPEPWVAKIHVAKERSGVDRTYYRNPETEEATWDRPARIDHSTQALEEGCTEEEVCRKKCGTKEFFVNGKKKG